MPDIERIVALLERYVDVPNLAGVENYGAKIVDMPAPLIADALALLRAREAIRPGLGIIHHDNGSKSYFLHCPLDGTTLVEGDNYCRKCGKAVKWG